MKEETNDKGLKIKTDKLNMLIHQKTNTTIHSLKSRTLITKNTKKYQTLKILVQWLLTIVIVEKMSKHE
jgi:hypothetical protein